MKVVISLVIALTLFPVHAAFAQDGEQSEKTTLHGLVADTAVCAARGIAAGASAVADAAVWAVHTTPAEYGRLTAKGGAEAGTQVARTPGRVWRGLKWGLAHI
ncbi:MAG TPA: hypothetical protein VD862_03225 [Candidatus Paceibacterota bacterium]|nr:hypothetical protein [Candidatus Paceibacterota bacterium]